jgi:hypothetical protein
MSQPPSVPQVNSQCPPANVDALVVSCTHRSTLYVPGESGTNGLNGSNLPSCDIHLDVINLQAGHLPLLQLADGKQEIPTPGKSLLKQKVSYLRHRASKKAGASCEARCYGTQQADPQHV